MSHSPRGSLWHRWDLHVHSPSSFDYDDKSITNKQIIDCLVSSGLRAVAITDHHTIDVARIRELQMYGTDKLTVLPGIELRGDHGGDPIHYICIFPENCDLDHVWTTLQGSLGLTTTAIREKGGDQKIYVPIEDAARETRRLGGVISIHAGAKSNSIEGINNSEQFQRRIKYDITKNHVDLMEIGQLKDIDRHLKMIFPATGLDKPLVLCSDNHKITQYSIKAPLWFRADPMFRGLQMVLREPRDRVYIGDRPPEMIRVEQNPTKYVRNISFQRKANSPDDGRWFSGSVPFNPGLVAIVGNKGSGKSALADTLGLLSATKNGESFSFLCKERFRHPIGGFASHFEATIEWESGDTATKCLADAVKSEEVERLKYLPQDHVETVCNELAGLGEEGFEQELKAVIFSHVPDAERLGHTTLDELVRFQTSEKQKRIDSLLKQLRDASRSRALLELQADPTSKRELIEKINRRKLELEAHDKGKPAEVINPAATTQGLIADADVINDLTGAETSRNSLTEQISSANNTLRTEERRHAVAKRLLEKLENFQKDYEVFLGTLEEDATELGLKATELVKMTITRTGPSDARDKATSAIATTRQQLNATEPPGFIQQLSLVKARIVELQSRLDAPNRAYQVYLKAFSDWQIKRAEIEGNEKEPESLKGFEASLLSFELLPEKIKRVQDEQANLALQIHDEKSAQAAVFRNLYGSVQSFIDSHVLAKDKLKLEFRAELTNEDFSGRLLSLLALNRRGSFMGIDDGRAKVESLCESVNWKDPDSVRQFLTTVDSALHLDQRPGQGGEIQLKDQLSKGKKSEEVFDLVYGLEYVRPRYILKWEGKDLSMLSPGERGTLLLVFYLLIDKGDMPLVIDQPEGNLDNHTVAKVLVQCIKEARKRRQVFIVTHNPNLAVVCDADQVVHASMDKASGNAISYDSGALENPTITQYVTDVLEGTRWAFGVRGAKYEVGD
jgi:predicted metal-dependent phosphoesterase TrpH/ABC-type cobalamin/Fe3+-siderophores transport system ATPase subunit